MLTTTNMRLRRSIIKEKYWFLAIGTGSMLEQFNSGNSEIQPAPSAQEPFLRDKNLHIHLSYSTAMRRYLRLSWIRRISWVTWLITIVTVAMWCLTAYHTALAAGAHSFRSIIENVLSGAQNGDVLVAYGAKDNSLILAGQYWRFITPIFLHANLLHIGLNMLNFVILGVLIERIFGHLRFLLIYLLTGVVSIIASFYFSPQDVSVGASGAIFGMVGAYSIFIFMHRHAFRRGGIPTLIWLVIIIGLNLGLGLVIPNVDNSAHLGGFLAGCFLGWLFSPFYVLINNKGNTALVDMHSLSRRWPVAIVAIAGTCAMALLALHLIGG